MDSSREVTADTNACTGPAGRSAKSARRRVGSSPGRMARTQSTLRPDSGCGMAAWLANRHPGPGRWSRPCDYEGSEMTCEPFGTRLRSLRERAGLTLKQLADKVGTN